MTAIPKDPSAGKLQLFSAELCFGWRGQLARVKRFHAKLRPAFIYPNESEAALDDYIVFFVFCYSIRDWMIAEDAASSVQLDKQIQSSEFMRVCRDVANRTKHRRISRASYHEHWRILGYDTPCGPER